MTTKPALNEITISRSAILQNLALMQSLHPGQAIFPVVKSNAYGHGIKEICSILRDTDVPYICVDSVPEYQLARKYSGKKNLILGETLVENYVLYDPRYVAIAVATIETLEYLISTRKPRVIHLFLDTGMHREGIQEQDLSKILTVLQGSLLMVEGVMSHFADADSGDGSMDLEQIAIFQRGVASIRQAGYLPIYMHLGNTAGTGKYTSQDTECNAWRIGKGLYGYNPLSRDHSNYPVLAGLQPALTLTSTVIGTQQVQTGESVSYAKKRKAETPVYTATIPFGYYEGLTRNLTNNRMITHQACIYPQIGTICMNMSCYNTGMERLHHGTRVVLIDPDEQKPNSLLALASVLCTIPSEVLVKLHPSIRRTIIS